MVAYNLIGNVAIRTGEADVAVRWFDVATRLDPEKSVPPRLNHAMALEMSGRTEAAISAYWALHEDRPHDEKISGKLARVLFSQEDFENCLKALGRIQSLGFDQFYMRGHSRLELGQPAKAIADLQEALRLRPAYPEAFKSLGEAMARVGRRREALAILRPLLAQQPDNADLHYTLGRIHFDLKELESSRDHLHAAISGTRHKFAVNRHLGIVHRMLGANEAAVPYLKTANTLNSDDYHTFDNLGEALIALERFEELRDVAVETLDADPENPSIWNAAGIFLKAADEPTLATEYLRKAAEKFPDQPVILFNLAHIKNETTLAEEAEVHARRAVLLKPDYAKAWNALCVSHCMPYRHAEARVAVNRALLIDRALPSAWLNVGVLERSASRFSESVAAMRVAIKLNDADFTAQTNLAYALLMAGEIEQGFRQYDRRWENPGFPSSRRPFPQPVWEGQEVPHHGLLLYMEQGMGDEIMFAWYFSLVEKKVGRVLVECDYRLIDLFKRSFPTFTFVARKQPADPLTRRPDIRYKTPAGHVPKHFWFETRQHSNKMWPIATRPVARTEGYLRADPDRRAHWRRYLDSLGAGKLRVGICWRSSVHNRARDLQYLDPREIADCFDERFVVINMQYDHLREETDTLAEIGEERGFVFATPPDINLRDDLDDLTALCAECDIVVTPLISTAFMAGSVGTPTWVFRSSDCGRIWQQLGAPYVPWFPSMRLFFRYPTDPWSQTIDRMRQALSEVAEMQDFNFRADALD